MMGHAGILTISRFIRTCGSVGVGILPIRWLSSRGSRLWETIGKQTPMHKLNDVLDYSGRT